VKYALRLAVVNLLVSCGGESAAAPEPPFDPKAPGPPEFPGEPLSEPFPWIVVPAGAAAAAIAVAFLVRHHRKRATQLAPPAEVAATVEGPDHGALQRLERLRGDDDADFVEIAAILKEHITERVAVPAVQMTSDELLAAPALARRRALLAEILRACDAVKFARATASAADRLHVRDLAVRFVRETTPP
jgi:hypothetical protein